jgi:hypothetical protein
MMSENAPGLDRRQARRFPVVLPVELEAGEGLTRDATLSGVYFETDQSFSPGEPIRLILVLEHVYPGRPVRLQCQGRVVRVERRDGKTGVAVDITSCEFDSTDTPGPWEDTEHRQP